MDNTETHYLTYDPDEIWREIIRAYTEAGGEPMYGGDEKEILLRGVQAAIVQVFAGVDNALRMQTLRYAVGDYLDLYGEMRGCYRIQASPARAEVTISFTRNNQPGIIPRGSALTADGENFYETTEDIYRNGYRQNVNTAIVASKPGEAGNALYTGTFLQFYQPQIGVGSVIVESNAIGGFDKESDDAYRIRIREHGLASTTTGTKSRYEAAAKESSEYVIDAKATIDCSPGIVAIYVLLSTTRPAEEEYALTKVREAVSADNVRPLTDEVGVTLAEYLFYSIKIRYIPGSATATSVQAAVNEYQNWQEKKIGRAFNPDRLISLLYSAGCERVIIDNENSSFDGGAIEYTEISENQVCSGSVWTEAIDE